MKKGALVLAAIAALLVVHGCYSTGPAGKGVVIPATTNPCDARPGGSNDPHAAIVCINYATFDQSGVQPSPNPVSVSRTSAANFWFYNYGSASPTLALTFTFATTPICNGPHCVVTPSGTTPMGQTKYSISDTSTNPPRQKDPDILIEP